MGWVKDLVTVTKHVGDATCRIWGGEEEPAVVGILPMERSLGSLTGASDGMMHSARCWCVHHPNPITLLLNLLTWFPHLTVRITNSITSQVTVRNTIVWESLSA